MEIDEAINLTQECLANEGGTLGDLLQHFRGQISQTLIGESHWSDVIELASSLPVTMAALPFGFELPLHDKVPKADLGASVASGTLSAEGFTRRAREDSTDATARAIMRLFNQVDSSDSRLRDIVGRKLMLEYDIGSSVNREFDAPGMFLRPGERPILGANGQEEEVCLVVDALVSSVKWEQKEEERRNVVQVYQAQPEDTRMDSFGIFPSRSRAIRLAVMGFKSQQEIRKYLSDIQWPGDIASAIDLIARFEKKANIVRSGVNIDVLDTGVGPTLGLTLIVKQRYTKDSRYWLDGLTDWDPFLAALGHEPLVSQPKLKELAGWVSKPSTLFAKSGRYVMLRGIHHIKLVVENDQFTKVKAYVFMVLSAAL